MTDVTYFMPCFRVPAGQCTPHRARATVKLLRQETQDFLAPNLWPQRAQVSVLWITISGLSCSILSITDKSIVWMNWNGGSSMSCAVLNSRFLMRLLTSGEKDIERTSMLTEDIWSTACELTMLILSISVTFNVTCLTVTSLTIRNHASNVGQYILVHFTR